jgi:hypothetical protein
MRLPIEYDLRKTADENFAMVLWVKKVEKLLLESLSSKQLIAFGHHYNVKFVGWENIPQDQVRGKILEVSQYYR